MNIYRSPWKLGFVGMRGGGQFESVWWAAQYTLGGGLPRVIKRYCGTVTVGHRTSGAPRSPTQAGRACWSHLRWVRSCSWPN